MYVMIKKGVNGFNGGALAYINRGTLKIIRGCQKEAKRKKKVVPKNLRRESTGFKKTLRNAGIGIECGEYIQVE